MIRLSFTPAAYEAIIATLPQGAPLWPVEHRGGQCLVRVEAAVVDRLTAMPDPARATATSSLRLVEIEAGRRP